MESKKNKAEETIKVLTKVVESVNRNKKEEKEIKNKKNIKCRDFGKPTGCTWGDRCKFRHEEDQGLGKEADCSYWMEGHCRFSDKVCWNKHNPSTKGSKPKEPREAAPPVFQDGQEQESGGPENPISSLDNEGWQDVTSRKNKRRMRELPQVVEKQKEIRGNQKNVEGQATANCPRDGAAGKETAPFPLDGESSQQIFLQALQVLLRQAGVSL